MSETEITPELAEAIREYEDRRAARVERFRNRASKAAQAASAGYDRCRKELSVIPMGQPILVGHHSERRHRNLLRRADNIMRRAVEASKKSDYYANRADAAESNHAIFSDDPAACIKLRERIAELEAEQKRMKSVNAALRSKNPDAALAVLGMSEATIAAMKAPDFAGRIGYPHYALSNNNANINRLKKRLAALERAATVPVVEREGNGVTVTENPLNGRIEIRFASKPGPELIAKMKAAWWVLRRKDGEWFWMNHKTAEAKTFAYGLLNPQ